jgi:DNA polymerase III alpha subunit
MTENNTILGLLNGLDLEMIVCEKQTIISLNEQMKKHYNDIFKFEDYSDRENQKIWMMPEKYYNLDIENYFEKFKNNKNKIRIEEELQIYKEKDLFVLLKYLIFLVDVMKENNVVWGVGRGSSCASYLLYLIELHDIDSDKYDISINEFLRG